jgi:hypothetical protein
MDTTAPPVTTRVIAGTGVIALDRPAALNALDLTMVRLITEALEGWWDDPAVRSVVIRSTSPKAFCAGGDIRAVRDAGLRGDDAAVLAYFSAEYALNALIARYPKPYTALIDGYAMGGGLGVSVHGSARVVTERAVLAMPETAIGFFPDIGASHFLPRPSSAGSPRTTSPRPNCPRWRPYCWPATRPPGRWTASPSPRPRPTWPGTAPRSSAASPPRTWARYGTGSPPRTPTASGPTRPWRCWTGPRR